MYYAKVTYHKDFDIPCHIQYCEIGDDLYVSRCVERFWNGEFGYASTDNVHGINGTMLPETTFFAKNELESESLEGEFVCEVITKPEFEQAWTTAVENTEVIEEYLTTVTQVLGGFCRMITLVPSFEIEKYRFGASEKLKIIKLDKTEIVCMASFSIKNRAEYTCTLLGIEASDVLVGSEVWILEKAKEEFLKEI